MQDSLMQRKCRDFGEILTLIRGLGYPMRHGGHGRWKAYLVFMERRLVPHSVRLISANP